MDIEKKATTINALISESYLLLQNMQGQEGSAYIETFKDTIKNLREIFEEFENYDLKNEVKNIEFKVDFVLQSSCLSMFCGVGQENQQERKAIFNSLSLTVSIRSFRMDSGSVRRRNQLKRLYASA